MSIYERQAKKSKNGKTFTVAFSYIDQLGIKQRYTKSGFQTKKEAKAFEVKQKAFLEGGGNAKECKKTVNDVWIEFIQIEAGNILSSATLRNYESHYKRYILNSFGNGKVALINYVALQKFFNDLMQKGCCVRFCKSIFDHIFKFAIKCNYITFNPMTNVSINQKDRKESKKEESAITFEQLNDLINSIQDLSKIRNGSDSIFKRKSYCIALYLGYYLGLRIGESLAIEKNDFDFENNTVYVHRKLEYAYLSSSKEYSTENMKTTSSNAVLPLCKPLKEILIQWFEENPNDLVCCTENGDFLNATSVKTMYGHYAKKLGFRFHSHMCRYAFVTNLIESGVNIKTVSVLARHSNIQTTLNVYAKVTEKSLADAIETTFNNDFYNNFATNSASIDYN